jgi:hypothetical protein
VEAERPVVELSRLVAFINGASQRGLKQPKVRVLGPDAVSEMRISAAMVGSKWPGSLFIKLAGTYLGRVAPDGKVFGPLASQESVLACLKTVEEDPARAASTYGALMCRCSFCGLHLTDEGSVLVGYGPICAERYGLAWVRRGVPTLTDVPRMSDTERQRLAADFQRDLLKAGGPVDARSQTPDTAREDE